MKKTILFDLDGTLLPLDNKEFETSYITSITSFVKDILEPRKMAESLWQASAVMVQSNDDTKTNEEVFYGEFDKLVGKETSDKLLAVLDDYYSTGFDVVKDITFIDDNVVEAVRYLKEKGHKVILATNPMFPKMATDKRILWAGFTPEDFDYVTRFEVDHFCKPNPSYYQEIMRINNLDPKECVMIGNDVQEDMMAKSLGMDAWLIDDNLIHRGGEMTFDWRGSRQDLLAHIKEVF
ncbi:HAD family hydrolase [Erysipelothrix sp. HDW6C]|uniref:HAD family hydrolase n=1 Tax=Erysipelothrix sp. HDW6C TaxID=2714930 RepID=UPI0014096421|nr:HAD family hydrolase [Erysipelothrix sp. HDW6C]QIK69904.1 HAD family hydrolase [Erysipelothrix sp. HDW6C]